MKILRVGDPHITVRNIMEGRKLMEFVAKLATENDVDRVEFMGDLFHTHAVVRVEVMDFWTVVFEGLGRAGIPVLALVGNHDQPGSKEKEQHMNSLNVFKSHSSTTIVDKPSIYNGIAYIPYMSDEEAFLKATQELYKAGATKTLVAHQTFTGAQYENGFYAPDGIDPELVSQEHIISGHIHKGQTVGKAFYTGTAKWDSMSDANEEKGVWIFVHDSDGTVKSKKFYSTQDVVTPIYKHIIIEGEDEPELIENAKNYVELQGKSAWIKKMKKKYKGIAQIKAKPVDRKMTRVDKAESTDIFQFLEASFVPADGVKKEEINQYLKEFIHV